MPEVNSPNWCWAQNGYRVERDGYHRTIYSPTGEMVLFHPGYDEEHKFCTEHGFIVAE